MSSDSKAAQSVRPLGRSALLIGTLSNAAYVLFIQVAALVTLDPLDFGSFSMLYLVSALGNSLCYSLISEAWLRTDLHSHRVSPWADYSATLVYLSALLALVALTLSWLVEPLRAVALFGAVAVFTSTYRSGARYHSLRSGHMRYVIPADVAGAVSTALLWLALVSMFGRSLESATIAWAAGALVSTLTSRLSRLKAPTVAAAWIREHRAEIGPLLRDSMITDLGGIGTPYALAPVLGLAQFGIYRAVSNVAAPIRLLINPIRPTISAIPLRVHRSLTHLLASLGASLVLAGGCYLALFGIGATGLSLGSLSELVAFALPTALFVAGIFFVQYYSIVGRTHLSGRSLLSGRVVQTGLGIVLPLGAGLFWGLGAAIWAYAVGTCVSGIVWWAVISVSRDEQVTVSS